MNRLVAVACSLLAVPSLARCFAGEAVVHWRGPDGRPVIETRISLPGPVTSAHLEAITLQATSSVGASDSTAATAGAGDGRAPARAARRLVPTVVSGSIEGLVDARDGTRTAAGVSSTPTRVEADWSGGRVTMAPLSLESCVLTAATYDGFIYGGESFFVDVQGGLSVATAVVPWKGDPDLYIWDVGNELVCSSVYLGKTRDGCAVISGACSNDFVSIEVYGTKKKNGFLLDVSVTEAS